MSPTALRTGLGLLSGVVWPLRCAGCGAPDEVLCGRCSRWYSVPRWCPLPRSGAGCDGGPGDWLDGVWGVSAYGGPVATLLSQWKERGRHDLTPRLALGLADAVHGCLAGLAVAGVPVDDVLLVPVPSTVTARGRRGDDHVRRLAAVSGRPRGATPCPLLRPSRSAGRPDDLEVGLSERLAGVGRYRARAPTGGPRPVVVVDDIVTSGATARDAVDALLAAGWPVVGVAAVAATPRVVPRLPTVGAGFRAASGR